jgi:hypothetical protein
MMLICSYNSKIKEILSKTNPVKIKPIIYEQLCEKLLIEKFFFILFVKFVCLFPSRLCENHPKNRGYVALHLCNYPKYDE